MIKIVVAVNAPTEAIQGIKETLGMYCERFGDTRIVSIKTDWQPPEPVPQNNRNTKSQDPLQNAPEQMTIGGKPWQRNT